MKHGEPGRNDPCPCGSRKKYKKCCLAKKKQADLEANRKAMAPMIARKVAFKAPNADPLPPATDLSA